MKKMTALFLAILIVISGISVYAADNSQMEKVLGIVKSRVEIPEEFSEFTYSSQVRGDLGSYDFSWNKLEGGGYIGIGCDTRGIITNYYSYNNDNDYYKGGQTVKLPKYSTAECRDIADEFFKRINPDICDSFKLIGEERGYFLNSEAYFSYTRVENGIDVGMDYASIVVNKETGSITNCNLNFTEVKSFPDNTKAISPEAVQKAYGEKIGFQLVYNTDWVDNKPVPILEYIPNGMSDERINAITGEIFVSAMNERMYDYNMKSTSAESAMVGGMGDGGAPRFSEQELKSIDENSGLLSNEQALAKLKAQKLFDIPKDTEIEYLNVSKVDDEYMMHINLYSKVNTKGMSADKIKLLEASGEINEYINATLNAKTGEVYSFRKNRPYTEEKAEDKDKLEKAALSAAKILLGNKAAEFELYDNKVLDINAALSSRIVPIYRNGVTLTRMVNDIPYMGNNCSIYANPTTGLVEYFDYSYDALTFPSAEGVVSADAALKAAFESEKYELKYVPDKYNYYDNENKPLEVSLVYEFKNYPVVDAKTGKLKEQYPTKAEQGGNYTDIENHWARDKIEKLASYDIYFSGTEFRPDEPMLQKDYIALLSIVYGRNSAEILRNSDINIYGDYYIKTLIKQEEEAPNSEITRFDAVKFMIRGMGAEEYAKLDGIYKTPFNDVTENEGYIALALGLKLISSGDNFRPASSVTRAEAISMLYNYLNR